MNHHLFQGFAESELAPLLMIIIILIPDVSSGSTDRVLVVVHILGAIIVKKQNLSQAKFNEMIKQNLAQITGVNKIKKKQPETTRQNILGGAIYSLKCYSSLVRFQKQISTTKFIRIMAHHDITVCLSYMPANRNDYTNEHYPPGK